MTSTNVRETKDRILDATEKLIAEQGIFATSLRQITAKAQVNLAAVNYHFQSKDDLVLAVYRRRIVPMNEERLALLDELEATYRGHPIPLDEILHAFFEPVLHLSAKMAQEGVPLGAMLGRIYTEPFDKFSQGFLQEMAATGHRYAEAMARSVPHLRKEEVYWRLWFTIGIVSHTLGASFKLRQLSQGVCDPERQEETLRQMVAFAKAGWEAKQAQ
jgi:AcrR family transcriptional regulator